MVTKSSCPTARLTALTQPPAAVRPDSIGSHRTPVVDCWIDPSRSATTVTTGGAATATHTGVPGRPLSGSNVGQSKTWSGSRDIGGTGTGTGIGPTSWLTGLSAAVTVGSALPGVTVSATLT